MSSPEETGDSEILSYEVLFDPGTGTWESVIGESSDYILNEANMTQNIVPGQIYKFKIKAKNIYGWAELYSDPVLV